METFPEISSEPEINGSDLLLAPEVCDRDELRNELESLREAYRSLESKFRELEDAKVVIQSERDEEVNRTAELVKGIDGIRREKEFIRSEVSRFETDLRDKEEEFVKKLDEKEKEKEGLKNELEVTKEKVEKLENERQEKKDVLIKCLNSLASAEDCLTRTIEGIGEEKFKNGGEESEEMNLGLKIDDELRSVSAGIVTVDRLARMVEGKVEEYKELRKKEKRELESSLVSLTEENRDINSLLRIALVEKEAVEKSLNRLKGNSEQKRVALLQIAERGLHRVGFGFMMGSGSYEQSVDNAGVNGGNKVDELGANSETKSDNSESEEEVISLASTVEKIMKNLRFEITQLRRSLDESRSDTERLQSLCEKQAQRIEDNILYIKELEDRERVLAQNVDELLLEIKDTEAEVGRWREACELEVKVGKSEMVERDKVVAILKQELEKTKSALDISNGKLQLKEELVAAAMAAQAAAEKSLQVADSRAAVLRERAEELTKQLEETESRDRHNRRVRHLCWPWRVPKVNDNSPNSTNNAKRMLPEMQSLLHFTL